MRNIWLVRLACMAYGATSVVTASMAAELPVPCSGGCTNGPATWVTSGDASAVLQGNSLTINQTSQSAILNWQSFNISADGSVEFVQPDETAVALNRIYQQDPSRIFGNLSANGRIYLVNQNGIIFGEGAQVNVGALVASTLNIAEGVMENGLVAGGSSSPAFTAFENGESAPLQVQEGARLFSDGGQIFLFAPVVENNGRIETPDGQTILAAGQSIYLSQSGEGSDLRGLVVAVDVGGQVTNGDAGKNSTITDPSQLVGQIIAERGNVTLAGLAVNQNGRVSATTSVRANGSIRLVAAQRGTQAEDAGTLTLGSNSRTEVQLDDSDETTVDVNEQPQSQILLAGGEIYLERDSSIVAPGGRVRVWARAEGGDSQTLNSEPTSIVADSSRIFMDTGASIDVSGANVTLPVESNVISVELRGTELADSAEQRNGALRGETVQVDLRETGTREDGSTWYGTPLADLSGDVAAVSRTVAERTLTGGTVDLVSQGDIIVSAGASVDVSGGSIQYTDGYIQTSAVLGADGRVYDISEADPNQEYVAVLNGSGYSRTHSRWGVTEEFYGTFAGSLGRFESGYVEGKDAGTLSLLAPNIVFDGDLVANLTIGPYQRLAASASIGNGLYRPFDQIPVGGELIIGRTFGNAGQFVVPNVEIQSGLVLSTLTNADGTAFDPREDSLADVTDTVRVRPELLGEGAATRLTIRADGSVEIPVETQLSLPAFSSVSIWARNIDVAGSIASSGGSVFLRAQRTTTQVGSREGELHLYDSAVIDVQGAWVNEAALPADERTTEALAIDGGTVTLEGDASDVVLEAGSVVDVSGGARMERGGAVTAGEGGSITVQSTAPAGFEATELQLDGTLRGYALQQGGTLSIGAAEVCIAADREACGSAVSENALLLDPSLFAANGFSAYEVESNQRGLTVGANTQVLLQAQNLVLDDAASSVSSQRSLASLSSVQQLDDVERAPVSLTLTSNYSEAQPLSAAEFPLDSLLSIQQGASILADPGATVQLNSDTSIRVDGTISAPGGDITLSLNNGVRMQSGVDAYVPSQSIVLGSEARLSVAGVARYEANDQGLLFGDVLDGGSITLVAQRGFIAANPGSVIDVSGTAAPIDVRQVGANGVSTYTRQSVASNAGTLSITAAESIVLSGELRAQSGDPSTLIGGTLEVVLDGSERYGVTDGAGGDPLLSEVNRRIVLTQQATPIAFGEDGSLPVEYAGTATLSADQIEQAGFDHVSLAARTRERPGLETAPGEVVLADGLDLSLRGSFTVDSASIVSNGGTSKISADVISLGQSSELVQEVPTTLASGTGSVQLDARLIDLVGHSVFSGFADVTLNASEDIRARGVQLNGTQSLDGSLRTTGVLTLQAQQVYPSTYSSFTFRADEADIGTIRVLTAPGGAATTALYSAAGSLRLEAPTIEQAGVLRAPFGSITLVADDVTLVAGSITSTSSGGVDIPFGETQGGFDWVYQLGDQTIVFGEDGEELPSQTITLEGDAVDVQDGATVDVSGGGDLVAYEFVPGVNGTVDVLSDDVRPDAFAIVPVSALETAPVDASIANAMQNDRIHLEGGLGIPAGDYVILPARYAALLPGAYYVRPVSGFEGMSASEASLMDDGSVLVSGYLTYGGTGLRTQGLSSGFSVRLGSEVQREAQYTTSSANTFFAAQATAAETAVSRLPRDAGALSIVAGESLTLEGSLLGEPATDGRGTTLDISSDALRVTNGAVESIEGVVDIDAASLNRFGAESILLGGSREQSADGVAIDTRADSVEIDAGVTLTGPELILVAQESVTVRAGAELRAEGTVSGAQPGELELQGDGALLRVTTGAHADIQRDASGGVANLIIEQGSRLVAPNGAIEAESAGNAQLAATLDVTGGVLALTGDRISLGDASGATSGFHLTSAQLSGLTLDSLILSSRSTLDLYDNVDLSVGELSLRAGAIRGAGTDAVTLAAEGTLTVAGLDAAITAADGAGTGTVTLSGGDVVLDEGTVAFSGFQTVAVTATRAIEVRGEGELTVSGDLSLAGTHLTAASGATRSIDAGGAFQFVGTGAAGAEPEEQPLGASLSVAAESILFDGRADLYSGVLELQARSGDVTLTSAADLRLGGVATEFDSVSVGSRGGWLTLQSDNGSVSVADGARIDVTSTTAESGERGRVTVLAANGSADLRGSWAGGDADFSVDAGSIADFDGLNARLAAGSFSGDRYVRQRGAGDLTLSAARDIEVLSLELIADQGQVVVDGAVRTTDAGHVLLAASDGITVNGLIDVSADDAESRDGQVELQSTAGAIRVTESARIVGTSGTAADGSVDDGTLQIRAPRALLETLTDTDATNDGLVLAGDLTALNGITIEGYAVYTDADGILESSETTAAAGTPMYDDAVAFAAQSAAIVSGLGTVRGPTAQLLAGIEVRSDGDLTVQDTWSLNEWRFNDLPGVLTLRAVGDLNIDATLNDGFASSDRAELLTERTTSWSYRLVAGSDLASADLLAVSDPAQSATGSLRIGSGAMVRTGTGSIDIAAARNVEFADSTAVVYTAGIAADGVSFAGRSGELGGRLYPELGGDIRITAGQDVIGAASSQLPTDWLWRVGREDDNADDGVDNSLAVAWTVNFERFQQNVGALAGGNVTVTAGGSIDELSVMVPTIGRQVGGRSLSESDLQITGGGNIEVRAYNDVRGGQFYSGRGVVDIVAGDSIGSGSTTQLAPIVLLGDAKALLAARLNASVSNVVNTTLLSLSRFQHSSRAGSFFSTYTEESAFTLTSVSGDATLENSTAETLVSGGLDISATNEQLVAFRVYPGTVTVAALRGDVAIEESFALMPTSSGGLNVFAHGDVDFGATSQVVISDAALSFLPSLTSPQRYATRIEQAFTTSTGALPTAENRLYYYGSEPERLSGGRTDYTPSRIVALTGDITMEEASGIFSAEPLRLTAGRDIVGLSATIQNLEATDVSSIVAGRDVTYPLVRNATGQIIADDAEVSIDGPGTLLIRAGRDFNLQASGGVKSSGNLQNTALAEGGADISVQVGVANGADHAAFIARYFESEEFAQEYASASAEYRAALLAYMQARDASVTTFDEALAAFRALDALEQAPLLERVLFSELRASGRAAAQAGEGNQDFSRGFTALTTYYPGANPDVDAGETNPYSGDMSLYFSRIYTQDGGDIRLLAPGGEINAGLASPPDAFGLIKDASQLGIVAQSTGSVSALTYDDFLVNESRVFAADGGDILVWATRGDIDAGRGAKTAISAPPPTITTDPRTGAPIVTFSAALTGSGIQTLATSEGTEPGDVDLFAPRGVVNAGDAGIVAGNLTIAATAVLGADNIQVSGVAVGVPVETSGLGASLSSVSSVGSSASSAAAMAVDTGSQKDQAAASLADSALSWLDVFIVGLGEDACRQEDLECLKRQSSSTP